MHTKRLVGKPEVQRIWRHGRSWEYNIKMDLKQIGCEYVDWIYLARDRCKRWAVVNADMNLRVP
jgi:hypothetical protein